VYFADLNVDIWNKTHQFSQNKSEIEIISFDGTSTIFKSKNSEVENKFSDAMELKWPH
jgi:hypothetical protein